MIPLVEGALTVAAWIAILAVMVVIIFVTWYGMSLALLEVARAIA